MSTSPETGTIAEMLDILRDEHNNEAAPLLGGAIGGFAGGMFAIAVEGVGMHDSSYKIPGLQSEVHGLQQARSEIVGATHIAAISRQAIGQEIANKRIEIQQDKYNYPLSVGHVAEVAGPIVSGAALGIFALTAITARLRIARRNRAATASA